MSDKRRPPPKRLRAWLAAYGILQPAARARSLRGAPEAEDALHDAFLRASRKKSPVKNRRSYLARAAHRVGLSAFRKRRRSIVSFDSELVDEVVESSSELQTPDMTEQLATVQRLNALAKRLPKPAMRAFTLCKVQGYSYEETATRLGISRDTVHKHVSDILRRCAELRIELRRGGTDK